MFNKKKSTTKKIDKLVTGFIIGGAVASMIGLSQTKKGKEITSNVKKSSTGTLKKVKQFCGKTSLKILDLFDKIKKDDKE